MCLKRVGGSKQEVAECLLYLSDGKLPIKRAMGHFKTCILGDLVLTSCELYDLCQLVFQNFELHHQGVMWLFSNEIVCAINTGVAGISVKMLSMFPSIVRKGVQGLGLCCWNPPTFHQ